MDKLLVREVSTKVFTYPVEKDVMVVVMVVVLEIREIFPDGSIITVIVTITVSPIFTEARLSSSKTDIELIATNYFRGIIGKVMV